MEHEMEFRKTMTTSYVDIAYIIYTYIFYMHVTLLGIYLIRYTHTCFAESGLIQALLRDIYGQDYNNL